MLFLHGYGESPDTCEMSADELRTALSKAGCELAPWLAGFVKLQGAAAMAPIVDKDYREMCISGDFDAYNWYQTTRALSM